MLAQIFTIGEESDPTTLEYLSYTCLIGDQTSLLFGDLPINYMLELGAKIYAILPSQVKGGKISSLQKGSSLKMLHLYSQLVNETHAYLLMICHQTKANYCNLQLSELGDLVLC